MNYRRGRIWIAGACAFVALATSALAQVHAGHPVTVAPAAHSTASPVPVVSMRPIALPSATLVPISSKKHYVHAVAAGTRVPLSELPPLPMNSARNTIVPGKHPHGGGHFRPMAATGATIGITAAAACATGGTVGQLFNVGCQLTIEATGMTGWSSTDSYEYYVVAPNSTTATAIGGAGAASLCTPTTNPWTPTGGNGPSCDGTSAELSSAGTYVFVVYDTTAQVIATSIYLNAGPIVTIAVYQDAYHSEPSYQFDTQSSNDAYIYLTNLASSDYYVAYVNATGVNTYCVYMTPGVTPTPLPPSPRPTGPIANVICNPQSSTGIQPSDGALSLTWPFASDLESGSYEIVVYDKSANNGVGETVASVQVSLTSSDSIALLTYGGTPAPNPSAGPNAPTSSTVVAWDSTDDQAVKGITGTTNGTIPAGSYVWSISDPDGRVVSTTPFTQAANGIATEPFVFATLGLSSPGEYPSQNWVMELYDSTLKEVTGSQSFQVIGYSSRTQFDQSGTLSTSLNITCTACNADTIYSPPATGLRITNTGNSAFPNAADTFGQGTNASIEFSTGGGEAPSTATLEAAMEQPPPNTGQTGTFVTLNAGATPAPVSACHPSCTLTGIADSNGNLWQATDYCSAAAVDNTGACSILLAPESAGTVLTAGAYVEIPGANMTWYAYAWDNEWACYDAPCIMPTSVLPTHGLAWSYVQTTSPAWTQVTVGSTGNALAGTTVLAIAGSCTIVSTTSCTPSDTTTPYAGTHFYVNNFLNGDYQDSTPFQAASNRADILGFEVKNTSTVGDFTELAIGFPAYFTVSSVQVDPNLNGTGTGDAKWEKETCPSGLGPLYFCVGTEGTYAGIPYNGTNTGYLYLDVPSTTASWAFNEFSLEGYDSSELTWVATSGGTITAAPVCGGGATCTGAYSPTDGLGYASYSLNSNLVGATFEPSTVGTGTDPTPLTMVVTNTSTAADPNPDPIDLVVIEQTNGSTAGWEVNGTPTVTGPTGWASESATGYSPATGSYEYWFGLSACSTTQYANHTNAGGGGPPQTPPNPTNPTTSNGGVTTKYVKPCTAAQEENALSAGESATINFNLNQALTAGTYTFYVYVHGANGGGWSAPKPVTLTVSSESAKVNFYSVQSPTGGTTTTLANGNIATYSSTPNTFIYEITNTSNTADIGKVDITVPAFDINNQSAQDSNGVSWQLVGSPITQNIEVGTIHAGAFTTSATYTPAGCAVNATDTTDPTPGVTNGQIEISGCTGFAPGDILAVEFQSQSPQTESDSYLFPTKLDGSFAASNAWINSDEVQATFSIGLSVVVDPSNPGPGASDPQVSCSQCAFSGSTVDFGPIYNPPTVPNNVTGTDVVRASVIYGGSTQAGKTWTLTMAASSNPTCVGCTIPNELLYDVEQQNPTGTSQSGCTAGTITVASGQQTMAAVSTSSSAVATGTETTCSSYRANATGPDYDVIGSFKVQVGTESATGQVITLTYTLVSQ